MSTRRAGGSRARPKDTTPTRRDNEASSFSPILIDFIARVPGAIGAVLVDGQGEAVDYAGRLDAYDLKLAGAHWQIVLREMLVTAARFGLGSSLALAVRGERRSFITHALPDDYVLVLLLGRRAGFTPAARAFAVCERALASEAGWAPSPASTTWYAAQVVETRAGRPSRIVANGHEHPVEPVGRITGLARSEAGWRVRLEDGAELMLVREPGGRWYADERVGSQLGQPPSAGTTRSGIS